MEIIPENHSSEFLSPPRTGGNPLVIENLEPSDIGLKVLSPQIIAEHLARYQFAAQYARSHFEPNRENLHVLDIASARGYGSGILQQEIPNGIVTGIEYGKDYIRKAHRKYPKPRFVNADARRLPIASESMDIVTAFEITEHLPKENQSGFFKEIARVLSPDGVAVVSIPEPYSAGGLGANEHHLHEPDQTEVKEYIRDSGLKIVESLGQIYVDSKHFETAKKINTVVPIWPIFAWGPKRDVSVKKTPETKLALTHVYVLGK